MNKLIGKLICAVQKEHEVLIGNEQEAWQWMEMIDAAVKKNGFALLRCSRCGAIVTRVIDEIEEDSDA